MAETKKTLRITQVKSTIARPGDQLQTLKALGLGKIGRTVEQVAERRGVSVAHIYGWKED